MGKKVEEMMDFVIVEGAVSGVDDVLLFALVLGREVVDGKHLAHERLERIVLDEIDVLLESQSVSMQCI